jgi:structure-specific endonuclease subunit SLX1
MSKPWYVYLLLSSTGATYVGATVDPDRRLRQHNKEIVGGARATGARVAGGETWRRVCLVSGFPDERAALQFEWMWKHLSRSQKARAPLDRRRGALGALIASGRSSSTSVPFAEWDGAGPTVEWALDDTITV